MFNFSSFNNIETYSVETYSFEIFGFMHSSDSCQTFDANIKALNLAEAKILSIFLNIDTIEPFRHFFSFSGTKFCEVLREFMSKIGRIYLTTSSSIDSGNYVMGGSPQAKL